MVTRADARAWNANHYLGLSTDTKPTDGVGVNALFYELDTKKMFYFNGTTWVEVGQ